jgi:thiol-disulfide isomerase/thioredoxin
MRLKGLLLTFILLSFHGLFAQNKLNLKGGKWTGKLQLNSSDFLPFELEVSGKKEKTTVTIINGEERIALHQITKGKDSLIAQFPDFNSRIVLHQESRKKLSGYWQNMNKNDYRVPLTMNYGYKSRFPVSTTPSVPLAEKWEITFDPLTDGAYKSVGLFSAVDKKVTGTFLTETGDYRFLEGNQSQDSLYLSCFDGSHAFLFKAKLQSDSIYGDFFSGKHWKGFWNGKVNADFDLTHPDSLTYLIKEDFFRFTSTDLSGKSFDFPNKQFENKVVIIQIMGTWCPNCMDEIRYLKDLHATYRTEGLEIISVGYEVGQNFTDHAEKIKKLKERYDLPFTFLVGGAANKGLASEHFSMLNKIISFPTAIFIAKDGTVRKVHTGFNGPGTGNHYTEFCKETDAFVRSLLNE